MFNPAKTHGSKWRLINPLWWLLFFFISIYRIPSKYFPNRCRFVPTCSTYAKDALAQYGAIKSIFLIVKRIGKCHPFHSGGFDPIMPTTSENGQKDSSCDQKNNNSSK